jgi:hypothetical protein
MMKNTKYILATILLLVIAMILPLDTEAQCAMCKATAEQSDQVGLNLGILYLFLMPYTIVGTIAFFWWRNRKKESEIGNFDPSMN